MSCNQTGSELLVQRTRNTDGSVLEFHEGQHVDVLLCLDTKMQLYHVQTDDTDPPVCICWLLLQSVVERPCEAG